MKGGITSGLVYPRAICHLATRYRIRRTGGASAGAIAAAFTAAAECGMRAPSGGFELLDRTPTMLGSALRELFQPRRQTAGVHRLLMAVVDRRVSVPGKVVAALRFVVVAAWSWMLVGTVFLGAVGAGAGIAVASRGDGPIDRATALWVGLLWVPFLVVVVLLIGAMRAVSRTMAAVADNGFGIVDGHASAGSVPLTDWLHARLNSAGRSGLGGSSSHLRPALGS